MHRTSSCQLLQILMIFPGLDIDATTCTNRNVAIRDFIDQTENSLDVV